jgi:hypothetical protein
MSLVVSCSSRKGMAIIEKIGLPPLKLIRDSEMGNDCFSTSTCFVLRAGVYGDSHARNDDNSEDEVEILEENVPNPKPDHVIKCPFCDKVVKNDRCLKHHLIYMHGAKKHASRADAGNVKGKKMNA